MIVVTVTLAELGRLVDEHGVEPALRLRRRLQGGGAGIERYAAVQR